MTVASVSEGEGPGERESDEDSEAVTEGCAVSLTDSEGVADTDGDAP